jgi:hypothetical protein
VGVRGDVGVGVDVGAHGQAQSPRRSRQPSATHQLWSAAAMSQVLQQLVRSIVREKRDDRG